MLAIVNCMRVASSTPLVPAIKAHKGSITSCNLKLHVLLPQQRNSKNTGQGTMCRKCLPGSCHRATETNGTRIKYFNNTKQEVSKVGDRQPAFCHVQKDRLHRLPLFLGRPTMPLPFKGWDPRNVPTS